MGVEEGVALGCGGCWCWVCASACSVLGGRVSPGIDSIVDCEYDVHISSMTAALRARSTVHCSPGSTRTRTRYLMAQGTPADVGAMRSRAGRILTASGSLLTTRAISGCSRVRFTQLSNSVLSSSVLSAAEMGTGMSMRAFAHPDDALIATSGTELGTTAS